MTAITLQRGTRSQTSWLRLMSVGSYLASVGLAVLALTQTFWTTSSGGDFKYAADYWMTAPALPIGLGIVLHAFAIHRLQRGHDGRLGGIGVWLFAMSSAVIVVLCMVSLALGAEVRVGPAYPVCALLSFVGLGLLTAGSWRAGLLPRWMLGAWPPLMLLGSWAGQSLIPLIFAGFLIASRAIIGRYIDTEQS